MPRITDQAVCIRLIDWSETSQIFAMLTRQHGVVRGLAKGSKRFSPSSIARYSGGIELLTEGQVVANIRPSSELANVTEWDLQQPWWHLRQNLSAHRFGLYAADLINALLAEHDPHPNCFTALCELLESLREEQLHQPAMLRFQWTLLCDCGYQPQLVADVQTGEELPDRKNYQFDPIAGGLTLAGTQHSWGVRKQTVDLLRSLADGEAQALVDEEVDLLQRANSLLCVYARALLDKQLPTMKFLIGE